MDLCPSEYFFFQECFILRPLLRPALGCYWMNKNINRSDITLSLLWSLQKSFAVICRRGMGCRGLRKKHNFPEHSACWDFTSLSDEDCGIYLADKQQQQQLYLLFYGNNSTAKTTVVSIINCGSPSIWLFRLQSQQRLICLSFKPYVRPTSLWVMSPYVRFWVSLSVFHNFKFHFPVN